MTHDTRYPLAKGAQVGSSIFKVDFTERTEAAIWIHKYVNDGTQMVFNDLSLRCGTESVSVMRALATELLVKADALEKIAKEAQKNDG